MASATEILKQYWGYDGFRPQQQEIIETVLAGKDTMALLPTGGGKSICYQVPALMMQGMCVVVSPLIALMQDQVNRLKAQDIPAACIYSGMHYNDVKRVLNNAIHGAYKLLYVSPERLQTQLFKDYLPELEIDLIAVDEAHCISQWGHDFRPDYLQITTLREEFPGVPILALTATATLHVQQDIAKHVGMKQPALFVQSFERKNIEYNVTYSENKSRELIEAINKSSTSNIVYCRSRKQTEALHKYLLQHNISSAVYHAGMSKERRAEAYENWMRNKTRTIIATTAFGMGIDKPDVGLVVNYDVPEHLEAYYQEAGRAGRNNQYAVSLILYNQTDINRLKESTGILFPGEVFLKQVYQSVAEYLQIPISTEPHQYYPFDLNDFCKKFKLNPLQTTHALKLLERENLWTISESVFDPPTVLCVANRDEIDRFITIYPQYAYFLTSLLRLYGSLFLYPTAIHIKTIARQAKIKMDEVEPLLHQLHNMGVIEYKPQAEGPQLFFHHYRVDSKQLIINFKRINELKKRHIERTDAILTYLQNTTTCRSKILLAYFGEKLQKDCEHCDVCKAGNVSLLITKEQLTELIKSSGIMSVRQLLSRFPLEQKQYLVELVRQMVDDKLITLYPTGELSI